MTDGCKPLQKDAEQASMSLERQLRESKAPTPNTKEELLAYIDQLLEMPHTYGSVVYAVSLAATATFNFVASKCGITGFQASCADLDLVSRIRNIKHFALLDYDNLLYPQYNSTDYFPSFDTAIRTQLRWLGPAAAAKIAEDAAKTSQFRAHPDVRAHWEMLVAMYRNTYSASPTTETVQPDKTDQG